MHSVFDLVTLNINIMIKGGIRYYKKISKRCRPQRPSQRSITEKVNLKPNFSKEQKSARQREYRSSLHKGNGV